MYFGNRFRLKLKSLPFVVRSIKINEAKWTIKHFCYVPFLILSAFVLSYSTQKEQEKKQWKKKNFENEYAIFFIQHVELCFFVANKWTTKIGLKCTHSYGAIVHMSQAQKQLSENSLFLQIVEFVWSICTCFCLSFLCALNKIN